MVWSGIHECIPRQTMVLYYTLHDDILLISPSITNLERLFHRCEHKLSWLDMSINLKKIILFTSRPSL